MIQVRKTSEVDIGFPYRSGTVCYFTIRDGRPEPIGRYVDGRREAAAQLLAGEISLYAVWPGQYRSDLFEVDEPEEFAASVAQRPGGAT